jgi:hypothetical protein
MANIVVAAIAKWNGSALVKGEKQLSQFQKTTLSLGKAFAATFALKKITNYGKAAVVAFAEAEAQQQRLTKLLRVTVGATDGQVIALNHQAEALEKLGVVTAGSITQVQSQLATFNLQTSTIKALTPAILDYVTAEKGAAASASEFKSMTNGLAQALNGNFASLTKTGFVLDDVTKDLIKNGSEADRAAALVKVLDSTYKGFNASLRKTTSGQLVALNNAADKAKETIGKGLVDSIALLGGSDGIQTATDNMENFGKATADTLFLFASLVKTFNETNLSKLFGLSVFAQINKLAQIGSQLRGEAAGQSVAYSPTSMYFTNETAERAKLVNTIKKQNTTEKEKQKLSAAELAAKKKQAELDQLKKKFDVDRINLETALANSTDEAEKARIRSLLTIMDEDANAAAKRMAQLDEVNLAKMKAELVAADTLKYLAQEADRAARGLASIGNPAGNYNYTAAAPSFVYGAGSVPDLPGLSNMPEEGNPQGIYDYSPSSPSFTYSPPTVNNFTISTPLGTEDALTETMQRVIQKLNRMGDNLSFAGAL